MTTRFSSYTTERLLAAFPWMTLFNQGDHDSFVEDLLTARTVSGNMDHLFQEILEWRKTAEALADPETREILLGKVELADFGPVPCPVEDEEVLRLRQENEELRARLSTWERV